VSVVPDSHHRGEENSIRLAFGLLTVSDSRSAAEDVSGPTMEALVQGAGHRIFRTDILPDEPSQVRDRVLDWALDPACDAIVTSGGTGLSSRDRTVEAVSELFDVLIAGFGELFRMLSYQEIGSAAMLTRALAGVVRGTPVFVLPGSPRAVTLGLTHLILPEIGHALHELRRHGPAR